MIRADAERLPPAADVTGIWLRRCRDQSDLSATAAVMRTADEVKDEEWRPVSSESPEWHASLESR